MVDEILNPPTKRQHFTPFIMHVVRRMGQSTTAVVSSVERQIVRPQKVAATAIDHVIAVAAYVQPVPAKGILFAQGECQISAEGVQ